MGLFSEGVGAIIGESFALQKWFGLYLEDAENSVPEGMLVQRGGIEPPSNTICLLLRKRNSTAIRNAVAMIVRSNFKIISILTNVTM